MRQDISIHAPLTGCDVTKKPKKEDELEAISIHAPLTGCDARAYKDWNEQDEISIHAPLTGCDKRYKTIHFLHNLFQSTHP